MQPLNVPAAKHPSPMALGAWNLPELLGEIAARDATIEQQQREIERLRERVEGQSELLAKTQQVLLELRAKLTNARQEMFGASRERMSEWQLDIFDHELEAPLPPQEPDLSIPVEGHRRKRRGKGRPALPDDLPRERVVHAMPEQELAQYDRVTVIGETLTRTLKYTPARISVVEHACLQYALVKDGVSTVRGMTFQASPLMKSNASPELLARIIVAHFDSGMPFYRLEEEFAMHGLRISRNTMSDWTIRLSKLMLCLYEAFRRQLLSAQVIFDDDTPFPQLCKQLERARTVRLWGYASAGAVLRDAQWVPVPRVVYYDYTASRAGCHPMALLGNYQGYLQADDYSGLGGTVPRWQDPARSLSCVCTQDVLQDLPAASQGVAPDSPRERGRPGAGVDPQALRHRAQAARCRSVRAKTGAAGGIGSGFARLSALAAGPGGRSPAQIGAGPGNRLYALELGSAHALRRRWQSGDGLEPHRARHPQGRNFSEEPSFFRLRGRGQGRSGVLQRAGDLPGERCQPVRLSGRRARADQRPPGQPDRGIGPVQLEALWRGRINIVLAGCVPGDPPLNCARINGTKR
jgi:transposase